MIQELIKQTEDKALAWYSAYLLWLDFMDEKKAQERLISELNKLTNNAIFSANFTAVDLVLKKEIWHNIFDEERQGIAKDKFSNIKRVIITELHSANWSNQNALYYENPRIIGRLIRLSKTGKNHCDICKNMVGAYPLEFVFEGFHPNCQCVQTPIYGKPGQVIKSPNRAIKFVELNRDKFKNWTRKPYWLKYF